MKDKIKNHFAGNYHTFFDKYLQKVKKIGGDEYQALCPFHDDKSPSFAFNDNTGEWFCHAGCGGGDAFSFYAKKYNLDVKVDFKEVLDGIAQDFGISKPAKQETYKKTKPFEHYQLGFPIEKYAYTDAKGKVLYYNCRFEPKAFRQCDPTGQKWSVKHIKLKAPYNLPNVIASKRVFVVGGEKDVHSMARLGSTATCNVGGEGNWTPDLNPYFKGKNIILIPDNDQAGRQHAEKVYHQLKGIADSIRLIELPDLPEKGDFTDWVNAWKDVCGKRPDSKVRLLMRLERLVAKTEPYEPEPKTATVENIILKASDFINLELPPKRKLLNPWLTEQSITWITGWRGIGKTWLVLTLLSSVSKGAPFGPWEARTKGVPCLFLDGEMPPQDIIKRIKGLAGLDSIYIYSDAYANSFGLPRANLSDETWRTTMKNLLIAKGIKLWAIDNRASLASGLDENAKKDWDPINAWLLDLRFAGIATIILDHEGKSKTGPRGTSAKEDNADTSIILKRPADYFVEDGCRFVMHFSKARVSTNELHLIKDIQFQLKEDPRFQLTKDKTRPLVWSCETVRHKVKNEVIKMLGEGVSYKTICDSLDISKGYVSTIKKQAIKDGLLDTKGKLTQLGMEKI